MSLQRLIPAETTRDEGGQRAAGYDEPPPLSSQDTVELPAVRFTSHRTLLSTSAPSQQGHSGSFNVLASTPSPPGVVTANYHTVKPTAHDQ